MSTQNNDHWNETLDFIESQRKKLNIPGCSLGILHHGELKTAGFGVSNVEKKSPVSADTLFQIGSISKTFAATVALKLVEEGKLDLHKPVQAYLPDFKVADESVSAQVTPWHLLTHSAGWDGDLFVESGDGADAFQNYISRLFDRQQLFPLGEYFSYNNSGFAVMGGILEAASGKSMEELLHTYILDPLELKRVFFNAGEVITYDFAVGHLSTRDGGGVARPWRMPRAVLPMGALVTNVSDLLRYAGCYMAKGKTPSGAQMLKPETVDDMFTPKMTNYAGDRTSVGYAWMRRELDSGPIIGHGGGTNGQLTQLSMLPEQDFALAFFTNSDDGGKLIEEAHKFLLKTYLDVVIDLPKEIKSTPEQLAPYAGVARRPGFNTYLEMLGDHLVGMMEITIGFPTENDPPPPPMQPFCLGRCAEDRLIILDGDAKDQPIDIFRGSDGKIAYMRMSRMFRFNPKG